MRRGRARPEREGRRVEREPPACAETAWLARNGCDESRKRFEHRRPCCGPVWIAHDLHGGVGGVGQDRWPWYRHVEGDEQEQRVVLLDGEDLDYWTYA